MTKRIVSKKGAQIEHPFNNNLSHLILQLE